VRLLYGLQWACDNLAEAGTEVSLFIDTVEVQIDSTIKPEIVELNIGIQSSIDLYFRA
jgi:pyridoxine 5'-phosphate synthase PdxJ